MSLCVFPASTRTKFESQWMMVRQTGLGDFKARTRFTCKGCNLDHQLIQDIEQLMVEKWESSEKSLWAMNQIYTQGPRLCTNAPEKIRKRKVTNRQEETRQGHPGQSCVESANG